MHACMLGRCSALIGAALEQRPDFSAAPPALPCPAQQSKKEVIRVRAVNRNPMKVGSLSTCSVRIWNCTRAWTR